MRVLIASDSFKGTFTSLQAADLISEGIRRVYHDAEIEKISIADGGEGTVEAIVSAVNGQYREVEVVGPLGESVKARYGVLGDKTAVIEMAESTGLSLVPIEKRNPCITSSYGFGEQIRAALDFGCSRIILGIGGSATNDGGVGMASALGVRFLDGNGESVDGSGGSLQRIVKIDTSQLDVRLKNTEVVIASDVENPLCGEKGASRVYGPQKGATPEMVEKLDKNLAYLAGLIMQQLGLDVANTPGAGAAGGTGAGLLAFCNARMARGIDFILDTIQLDRKVQWADIVITGEGRIDSQSVFGKVPVGIAARAKRAGRPVFAICGFIGDGADEVYDYGIDAVMSAVVAPVTIDEAIKQSSTRIVEAAERLFRIIRAVK